MTDQQNELPESDFPVGIGKPAKRALLGAGYTRLEQPAGVKQEELLELHGVGPKALAVLRGAMADNGLSFADDSSEEGRG